VLRALPLKFTTELLTKPAPVTVRVKAPEFAATVDGCSLVMAGTGLFAAVMVKVSGFDVPPPGVGLVTVTEGVPVLATSLARIAAVT